MDDLDKKIIDLLAENARMTVKDIAKRVSLTSPAVSERIRRMERSGVIKGYTVVLNDDLGPMEVHAIISIYVQPQDRPALDAELRSEKAVRACFQVTGTMSHMIKVACSSIQELNSLILRLQKLGQTNTQIILSAMIEHGAIAAPG